MQEHHFKTPKTARYFVAGDLHQASEVWIVLHGYAQLASDFLKTFDALVKPNTAIVAPEGFHRFYRKGFYGDVVASWMTKEDRLNDISDYITFLNEVYSRCISTSQTVHVLGFSQGVATACRWLAESEVPVSNLILWAGTFPQDINLESGSGKLKDIKTYLAYDKNDPFRTEESWQKQLDFFQRQGLTPTLYRYEGGHKIPEESFIRFVETYINPSLSN